MKLGLLVGCVGAVVVAAADTIQIPKDAIVDVTFQCSICNECSVREDCKSKGVGFECVCEGKPIETDRLSPGVRLTNPFSYAITALGSSLKLVKARYLEAEGRVQERAIAEVLTSTNRCDCVKLETTTSEATTVGTTTTQGTTAGPTTAATVCGNGKREVGEACDDANMGSGDGCSSACGIEMGYTCSGGSSTTKDSCTQTVTATCGNGLKESGEGCDDSNTANGDGCSATCTVDTGYTCTGGSTTSKDICSAIPTASTTTAAAPTAAGPVLCAVDQYVKQRVCTPCPVGTVNFAGNDVSLGDTTCLPVGRVDDTCFENSCLHRPGFDVPCTYGADQAMAIYYPDRKAKYDDCEAKQLVYIPYYDACKPKAVTECMRGCYKPEMCSEDWVKSFVNGATSQCIPQSYEEDGHQYKCELPAQMAGVLITAGAEVDAPPKDSKDLNSGRYNYYYYGVSSYARLVRILEKRSGAGQFGLFGQWVQPYGQSPLGQPASSIEGGLIEGTKLGFSYYPKYLLGASTHMYSHFSDTSGGWGFFEKCLPCQYLGRVVLSNKVVIPPAGLSFEPTQNKFEEDDGIYLGGGWISVGFFSSKSRNDGPDKTLLNKMSQDDGRQTWTFFMDTQSVNGPLVAYLPEMFYRKAKEFDAFRVKEGAWAEGSWNYTKEQIFGGLGINPANSNPSFGGEIHDIPMSFFVNGSDGTAPAGYNDGKGPVYWKAPSWKWPNKKKQEYWARDMRTYDVNSYNKWHDFFAQDGNQASYDSFDPSLIGSWSINANPYLEHIVQVHGQPNSRIKMEGIFKASQTRNLNAGQSATTGTPNDHRETSILITWNGDDKSKWRYPEYWKTEVNTDKDWSDKSYYAKAVWDESEVPAQLKNAKTTYSGNIAGPATYAEHDETKDPDHWCFTCNITGCDRTIRNVTLEDGAIVSYQWFKFRDQPALRQAALEFPTVYTEAYLDKLQGRVEKMHKGKWFDVTNGVPNKPFIKRPSNMKHLAEVERALLVSPPVGKEYGWVPVAIGLKYPPGSPTYEVGSFNKKSYGYWSCGVGGCNSASGGGGNDNNNNNGGGGSNTNGGPSDRYPGQCRQDKKWVNGLGHTCVDLNGDSAAQSDWMDVGATLKAGDFCTKWCTTSTLYEGQCRHDKKWINKFGHTCVSVNSDRYSADDWGAHYDGVDDPSTMSGDYCNKYCNPTACAPCVCSDGNSYTGVPCP